MEPLILNTIAEIDKGVDAYLKAFREITQRGQKRFEEKDWHGIQADSVERINLYKKQVRMVTRRVRRAMGPRSKDRETWKLVKYAFDLATARHKEFEIAETFFNSVCRKVLDNVGADPEIMFVIDEGKTSNYRSNAPIFRTYRGKESGPEMFRSILLDVNLNIPFEDMERDIQFIMERANLEILFAYKPDRNTRAEVLNAVFYRNKAAYVVGRLLVKDQVIPLVIPLLHGEHGIFADTLIVDPNQVSIIFSFTRSYFLVETEIPSELVDFLQTLMPDKPVGDLYNSIGFSKHGKTEQYRDFLQHLNRTDDKFVVAPGIRGMVMAVFTLPSYHLVFKLIKDEFDKPKKTDKAMVRAKYRLVSRHDRVGRMADTHEYQHFMLPRARFDEALLAELLDVAPSSVHVEGDFVRIDHLYTERKMIPLNIYLNTTDEKAINEAVDEYGNTIKELAAANIFPGDMLLKNFGVTRHGRVVFYDYDEIGLLTEFNFREMPKARDTEEIYAASPWFAIGPKDVFPAEFRHFLIGKEGIEDIFLSKHADLFEVAFWRSMQDIQEKGEILDVFPYRRKNRFLNKAN